MIGGFVYNYSVEKMHMVKINKKQKKIRKNENNT